MLFIANYIRSMLNGYPALNLHCSRAVAQHYDNRAGLLRVLQAGISSIKAKLPVPPARDERIQCLHTLERDLAAYSLAQLYESKAELPQQIQLLRVRQERLEQLAQLRAVLNTAVAATDYCNKWLANAAQGDCVELRERMAALCEERDSIMGDIHGACQSEDVQSTVHANSSVWQRLHDLANTFAAQVLRLQPTASKAAQQSQQAAYYRAEAVRTAQICSNSTPYQTKIAACWEQAAVSIVADESLIQQRAVPRYKQYIQLAEGVFASAVTSHIQWERAVQRRDDKLADFWQRARERAWQVGCEAFTALQNDAAVGGGFERISSGVALANRAQELFTRAGVHPLTTAEADLQLVLADVLVMYSSVTENSPLYRQQIRLAAKLALEVIALFCPVAQLEWPGNPPPTVTASEESRTALRWCARTLAALHNLSRVTHNDTSTAWQAAVDQITMMLTQLKRKREIEDDAVTSQRMFVVELKLMAIEQSTRNQFASARWLEILASTYTLVLPGGKLLDVLPKGVRDSIVRLRLQLARALEAEVAGASTEVAQWLTTQWPEEKRGFPGLNARASRALEAIVGMVETYRSAVQWHEQMAAVTDITSALHSCLKGGSDRWTALADHRRQWAEHSIHGRLEDSSEKTYARAALVARGDGLELALRATEVRQRALRGGNSAVGKACEQICQDLTVITWQNTHIYSSTMYFPINFGSAEQAVAQILLSADHALRATSAELDGDFHLASAWRAAAQAREKALDRDRTEADRMLLRNSEKIVKRADALAQKATLLEEKKTVGAVVGEVNSARRKRTRNG
jgi:hypothetical protein